jgi:hypothetical protein
MAGCGAHVANAHVRGRRRRRWRIATLELIDIALLYLREQPRDTRSDRTGADRVSITGSARAFERLTSKCPAIVLAMLRAVNSSCRSRS